MRTAARKDVAYLKSTCAEMEKLLGEMRIVCNNGNKVIGIESWDELPPGPSFEELIETVQCEGLETVKKTLFLEIRADSLKIPNKFRVTLARALRTLSAIPLDVLECVGKTGQDDERAVDSHNAALAISRWYEHMFRSVYNIVDMIEHCLVGEKAVKADWEADEYLISEELRQKWKEWTNEERDLWVMARLDKIMEASTRSELFSSNYYQVEMKRVRASIRSLSVEKMLHVWNEMARLAESLASFVSYEGREQMQED